MSASILDDVRFPNGQFLDLQVGEPCSLDRDANRNAADGERADRESTDRRGDGQTPHLCADIPLKYLTFNFTSVRERVKSSILSGSHQKRRSDLRLVERLDVSTRPPWHRPCSIRPRPFEYWQCR